MTQTKFLSQTVRTKRGVGAFVASHQVKQWTLVAEAGRGTFSRVFQARPANLAKDGPADYALKMLRPRWHRDDRAMEQFRRESIVGRSVSHPHLISILASNVTEPPYFVVMPWLVGMTFEARLAHAMLGAPSALWIVRQVAEALEALDASGWTHGDIKPGNVFLSSKSHVTLLDLGFARHKDENVSEIDPCLRTTYPYAAPETLTSSRGGDIRSDIYSLGIMLYETLAGRLPFDGQTSAEWVILHTTHRPISLRRLAPHLPKDLIDLVTEMLAKEPLRRPQTPSELIERLVAAEISLFGQRSY